MIIYTNVIKMIIYTNVIKMIIYTNRIKMIIYTNRIKMIKIHYDNRSVVNSCILATSFSVCVSANQDLVGPRASISFFSLMLSDYWLDTKYEINNNT